MLVAAALCPGPPLLLRELTGCEDVAADVRAACGAALGTLLAAAPDVVVVVGAQGPPVAPRSYAPLLPPPRVDHGIPPPPGPLSLLVGTRLLDHAGWGGARLLQAVDADADPAACAALGARLADAAPRVALLAVGDGSARRGPKAPGYVDERALPFDDEVVKAVRAGDAEALLALDPGLARDLLAAGRPAWQVLAGALLTSPAAGGGDVLLADDPFGVLYLVATFSP